MIRKILPLLITALLVASCGSKSGKGSAENSAGNDQAVNVRFAALAENPGNYIGKNIIVEGKVVHVCPHTGKKMFIVGDNPDIMLYVSAGENTPKFPMELLGTRISVEGQLTKAVTADKPGEEKMNPGMGNEMAMGTGACSDTCSKAGMTDPAKMAGAECETETALAKQAVLADLMMIYNKHTLVK
jgi:hypothetical protein